MVLFKSCSCWPNGTVQDLLQCAPCPPPMLNYSEFRQHALNRTLCLAEVCNIARRCRPEDPDVEHDCFPESTTVLTTHDGTAGSSSHTTDHSIFTTDFSASTTDYTTELKTDSPISAAACNSTCVSIISVVIAVCAAVIVVILVMCLRWKKRKDKTKNNHKSSETVQTGETLDTITNGSEGMDVDANTEDDKSLCNKRDNNFDKCYSEDETNHSGIDQPDGESAKHLHTKNNMNDVTDNTEDTSTSQRYSEDRLVRESVRPLQTSTQTNTCEHFSKCEHKIHSTRL